ncbi:MAG TPA: ABC transporter permease [Longimicrobiales bacterium]
MPEWKREIGRRLRTAGLRGSEANIVEELSQHLDDRYAELRASGLGEEEARAAALEELDEEDVLGRRVRQSGRSDRPEPVPFGVRTGSSVLGSLAGDVRLAGRVLWRSPGFTVVAVLVIALGIGANTAIFSVINSILLRPLQGVRDPSTLVAVYTSDFSGPRFGASSYPDYESIVESGVFEDATIFRPRTFSLALGERAESVLGEMTSASFFDMLGVQPELGRFFGPEEAGAPGTSQVAVISHELWQREFGGARDVIGRPLRINGQVHTIIGVAPRPFRGATNGVRMDVWLPLSAPASVIRFDPAQRGSRGLFIFGRLAEGGTIEGVQSRLDVLAGQLHAEYPGFWTDLNNRSRVFTVLPESDARVPRQIRGAVLGIFGLLVAVVLIVLLIACTNVANLMLARASARRAEMGVRLALGATRGRIVRQLLAESVLLASIAGALGVLLAVWLTRAVRTLNLPVPLPVALDVSLDVRALGFAAAVTLLTGVLFGLLPALAASRSPAPMMKNADAVRARRAPLRSALVVVQVAASIVLLAGAGLFLRSLLAARSIDTGITAEHMVLVPLDPGDAGYTPEAAQRLHAELLERVRGMPGVTHVTLADFIPFSPRWGRRSIDVEGYAPREGEDMELMFNGVGPGYFEAMGIRLRGRDFTAADRAGAPGVVVVNEAFVRRFWPGSSGIGMRVSLNGDDGPYAEVIGVAPDVKYRSLTEDPVPYIYYPTLQSPASLSTVLHVRTGSDPSPLVPALRNEIRALAPALPLPQITTLTQQVGMATLLQRIAGIVLGVLGGLAVAIATIGLYGVIAYSVAQRTREFGIRTALGAPAADVQYMVLRQGLRLALLGAAIGVVLALALARAIRSMLLVSPMDPVAIMAVVAVLIAAALVASWIPARRATRADPLLALRAE